jgi:hypothetical protein
MRVLLQQGDTLELEIDGDLVEIAREDVEAAPQAWVNGLKVVVRANSVCHIDEGTSHSSTVRGGTFSIAVGPY